MSISMTAVEFGAWMDRMGLTDRDAANVLSVDIASVQHWLTGRSYAPPCVALLCTLYETPVVRMVWPIVGSVRPVRKYDMTIEERVKERIERAGPDGIAKTELQRSMQGVGKAAALDLAVRRLIEAGAVREAIMRTGKRPGTRYFAT